MTDVTVGLMTVTVNTLGLASGGYRLAMVRYLATISFPMSV